MSDILADLTPIFQDIFDQPTLTITRASNASTVEGWDSLAHVNLVMSIEQHYGIRFALGELEELKNVGEMADLIAVKLSRR
jgi:acyl carrier protein